MAYVGIFRPNDSFALSGDMSVDGEWWDTIGDAKNSLRRRYRRVSDDLSRRVIVTGDGVVSAGDVAVRRYAAGVDGTIVLYDLWPHPHHGQRIGDRAVARIELGPRGGPRVVRL